MFSLPQFILLNIKTTSEDFQEAETMSYLGDSDTDVSCSETNPLKQQQQQHPLQQQPPQPQLYIR